jgi:hypothetical protein
MKFVLFELDIAHRVRDQISCDFVIELRALADSKVIFHYHVILIEIV